MAPLPWLLVFVGTASVAHGQHEEVRSWKKRAKAARKKGLTGYDLVAEVDPFKGVDTPDFSDVIRLIESLAKSRDEKCTIEDFEKIGIPLDHFRYFDKNKDGELDPDEAYFWFMQRDEAKDMDLNEVNNPPKGHMQPLGSHRDPLPSEDLKYHKPYPHPRDFWKKHMDGYLPAVLKGAQKGWPAMDWDRETLKKKFGWVEAKIEPKREGRGNDTAYSDIQKLAPHHRLSIAEYLEKEKGRDIYVVSIIAQPMAWEVAHPSPLLCGSRKVMIDKFAQPPYRMTEHEYPHEAGHEWMTHLMEANLWIASGGTRSQFHYDKEWNVHCSLRGTKRWVFFNSFETDGELQWARGNKFRRSNPLNNAWTDWVYLNPDAVDLILHHKLRKLDYYELIQEPGDCIFIPYAMLHQVTSVDKGLQIASSWMFLPETVYDEKACSGAPLEEDLPLAAMDTLYAYTGKGIIPQGYVDPMNLVRQIEGNMKQVKAEYLTLDIFREAVTQGGALLKAEPGSKKRVKSIWKILSSRGKDPQKGLHIDELRTVPLRIWCKPAAEGDNEGPLPCDDGQEYVPMTDEEFQKSEAHIRSVISKQAPREAQGDAPSEAPPRIWNRPKRSAEGGRPKSDEL